MRLFKLPEGARFSNKDIFQFMLPVLFEQFMIAGLKIADTYMVSFISESAVAGVSLVSTIDTFVKQFLSALAIGGTVVLSQYIGAKDHDNAEKSLKNNIQIVLLLGLLVTLIMVLFKAPILNFLFGSAEKSVIDASSSYFTYTALSYPFFSLYYIGTSAFRSMGETKIPLYASVFMMIVNLILKYIFIFHMDMQVLGAALSTLLSVVFVGFVLLFMLFSHHNKVRLTSLVPDVDIKMTKRILKVSVPNGIEQAMFQFGILAIANLISTLGTAAIAAHALAQSITPLLYSLGASFNAVIIVVVGRCMGADDADEAEFYIKHILKLDYICTIINAALLLAFLKPIISMFGVSQEANELAFCVVCVYTLFSIGFYPTSFAMAAALRGSGDTKFVMLVSTLSMFIFRIGAAYFFVNALHLSLVGTWLAMGLDWVIRSGIFYIRYKRKKWKLNRVI